MHIHKQEQELCKPENWRPITINSLLMRMFTGLISDRFQDQIKFARAQKGFCLGESTASNCFLLDECLKKAKENRWSICNCRYS